MKPIKLSPSSISLFLECPRCFWLNKIKGVRRPSGPFPSLPSGMDKILKVHFDKHRNDKTPPEEVDGLVKGHLYQDTEKLKIWQSNFKGLQYTDPKSGFILMGALDDLFVTSDEKYAPLDFKTRGFPKKNDTHEHYQHQMDIYSFLLEKNNMKPADFAILIFYHPISVDAKHHVEFAPEPMKVPIDRKHGEKIFMDAVKCLQGKEPKETCEWCRRNENDTKRH